ncbi:MAG: hypothetical protein M3498_04040 [Deinococcota bacterium]|nr:hypothetical protein [Deinococcota bacterium]
MTTLKITLAQLGVALLIICAIVFFAVGLSATGLLVGDAVFVLLVITSLWLLVRVRLGHTRRRSGRPAHRRGAASRGSG